MQTIHPIMGNGNMIKSMGGAPTHGQTEEYTPEIGWIVKCTEKERLSMKTEGSILVNIRTTRERVMAFIHGLMVKLTMGNGRMVSKMGRLNSPTLKAKLDLVNGPVE